MADTAVHGHHEDESGKWDGGQAPMDASYGKLMMWYFLVSDAFTFAGFLIAYGTIRFSMPAWPVPDFVFAKVPFVDVEAPLVFVTFMTFVLIISSVTMVRAVQEGARENKRGVVFWMALTILGGATFLGCQAWEWNTMINGEGVTVTKDPFSSQLEGGTYVSGEELVAAGFIAKKASDAPELQGLDLPAHASGDYAEGEHQEIMYYLKPGVADIEDNRLFVKRTHSKKFDKLKADNELSFAVKDPYLITYGHDTHLYEPAAFRGEDGEIRAEAFGPIAFGSLFFFITGFHGFHVLSGVIFLIIIMINVASGLYAKRKNGYEMVEKIGLYWHFVDLVWVFVFLCFYLL
jgi:cytochrome c oxidase subunit 3